MLNIFLKAPVKLLGCTSLPKRCISARATAVYFFFLVTTVTLKSGYKLMFWSKETVSSWEVRVLAKLSHLERRSAFSVRVGERKSSYSPGNGDADQGTRHACVSH